MKFVGWIYLCSVVLLNSFPVLAGRVVPMTKSDQIQYYPPLEVLPYYVQQVHREIEINGGSGTLMTYRNAADAFTDENAALAGPYVLINEMPRYNVNSPWPILSDRLFYEMVREAIQSMKVKVFVGGWGPEFGARVPTESETEFRALFPNNNEKIMIISVGTRHDIFRHELEHLSREIQGERKKVNKIIADSIVRAKKIVGESGASVPEASHGVYSELEKALVEIPVIESQLAFIEKQNASAWYRVKFHRYKIDPNNGGILEKPSVSTNFFSKESIGRRKYQGEARQQTVEYAHEIYRRLEKKLSLLTRSETLGYLRELCTILETNLQPNGDLAPRRNLPSCRVL